ncbi:hypothetical protein A1359_02945 [Methylomonas lenta]|uniref:DUF2914 domain-containing protein n=1 Tax=Methylomonas lenta TaxID=980561 RepID=A0A177NR31_9GAMM|nr:DUF2914 domain-containing protein [Methylomonas lenta]OAI20435.1 hypothetical protein A1359_02945 [Methylomonas lenta]
MADNKVVIKINYDKDRHRKALIDPKMVTVWHTRRILGALIVLLVLVYAIYGLFSGENTNQQPAQSSEILKSSSTVTPQPAEAIKPEMIQAAPQPLKDTKQTPVVNQLEAASEKVAEAKRPAAIIFDKRVIRASINTAPKSEEPGDAVKLPVHIEHNKSLELFYFSQIKNMRSNVLFHRWYKDGQLVHKKQFTVKSNNAKLISSKNFTANDVGEWQVTLVNNKGDSLSEVNYSVRK